MKFLQKILGGGNILYYPGCLTKFAAPELEKKYEAILRAEKIDFIKLSEGEFCCGSPAKNCGAEDIFEDLARKNLEFFSARGVRTIISNCPSCVAVFQIDYRKILGDDWNIEAKHVSQVIGETVNSARKVSEGKIAAFHDPCHLGRALGLFDPPREIVKAAGYELVEMDLCREKSFCCGAGGGAKSNEPELSLAIGKDRVGQAKAAGAEVLITNCPMCYKQLEESADGRMEVLELSQLFDV